VTGDGGAIAGNCGSTGLGVERLLDGSNTTGHVAAFPPTDRIASA
jgi:hypothetical protein